MNTPILPDGSSYFVSEVMSKEEALALPLEDRPLCFRLPSKIYHDVFEAVGAASMCWQPRPTTEVFNPDEATRVAVALCFKIAAELERMGITYYQFNKAALAMEGEE